MMFIYLFGAVLVLSILLMPSTLVFYSLKQYKEYYQSTSNMFINWLLGLLVWLLLISFLFAFQQEVVAIEEREDPKINNLMFLDMDCILAYDDQKHCLNSINNLNRIIESCPQVSIVVSSDWKIGKSVKQLQELTKELGIKGKVIGATPILGQKRHRGDEITAWLKNNNSKWDGIIILNTYSIPKFKDIQVLTGPEFGGLKGVHAYFAVDKLNSGLPKNFNVGEIETICELNIKKEMSFGGQILQQKQ